MRTVTAHRVCFQFIDQNFLGWRALGDTQWVWRSKVNNYNHGDFLIINTSRCSVDLYSAVLSPVLKNFMFHVYTHGIQITTMSPAQHLTTSCQVYTLHISQSLSNEMKDFFWIAVAIILIYLQPKKSNILIAIYHKHVCNRNPGDVCDGRPAEHSGAWRENQSLNRCEVH